MWKYFKMRSESENQRIQNIWEQMENMTPEQRNVQYIKSKSCQDLFSGWPLFVAGAALYLSDNQYAAVVVGFLWMCLFMPWWFIQRKRCATEICIIELINKKIDSINKNKPCG